MRLVFAGTPEFARSALVSLHEAGHEIVCVMTQPDRPAGRGLSTVASPVKTEALARSLPVVQPVSLRHGRPGAEEAEELLRRLAPDVMVVAAYGLLLPSHVLALPKWGCINIHASLLPRWRGAAPIQRAIMAGDTTTGICLMQMEEGLDTGPVWQCHSLQISSSDTFQTVHDRLSELGARLIVDLLAGFPESGRQPTAQAEQGVTYAHKIVRQDCPIDWSRAAQEVSCHIRALDSAPGATTRFGDEVIKVFGARVADGSDDLMSSVHRSCSPGQIVRADRQALVVACGHGFVALEGVQRPGGRRLGFREFLNGRKVIAGQFFESIGETSAAVGEFERRS